MNFCKNMYKVWNEDQEVHIKMHLENPILAASAIEMLKIHRIKQ